MYRTEPAWLCFLKKTLWNQMEGWIWAASPRMPTLQNSSKNGQFTAISNNMDESHKHRVGQDRSNPRARSSWCQFYEVQAQAELLWRVLEVRIVAVPLQVEPMEGGMRRLSGCFFPSGLWIRSLQLFKIHQCAELCAMFMYFLYFWLCWGGSWDLSSPTRD